MPEVRNIGAEITLSEVEQAIARHIGKLRQKANRAKGVQNNRIGPQSDDDTDVEGFAAELASCKLFNVYPDFSIEPRSGGKDFEHMGVRFDTKETSYPFGQLLATMGKRVGDVDVYVLMIGKLPTYRFAGCAKASELLLPERITDLGHGDTYALPQSDLYSLCYRHGFFRGKKCPGCEREEQPALFITVK